MGEGLLTAEGETWRRQRKLAQPAFHHENMVEYGTVTVDCTSRMFFGTTILDRANDIAVGLQSMMEKFRWHASISLIVSEWLPLPVSRRVRRGIRKLDDVFYSITRERGVSLVGSCDLPGSVLRMCHSDGPR